MNLTRYRPVKGAASVASAVDDVGWSAGSAMLHSVLLYVGAYHSLL